MKRALRGLACVCDHKRGAATKAPISIIQHEP